MNSATTMKITPIVSVRLWRSALILDYALLGCAGYALIYYAVRDGLVQRAISAVVSRGHNLAPLMKTATSPAVLHDLGQIALIMFVAMLVCRYLHLKISVPGNARQRLVSLRNRIAEAIGERDFNQIKEDHVRLGELLLVAGVIDGEQLVQALELSRATHRLLGECLRSFGWLSGAQLDAALSVQEMLHDGTCSRETALLRLEEVKKEREHRSMFEIQDQPGNWDDEDDESDAAVLFEREPGDTGCGARQIMQADDFVCLAQMQAPDLPSAQFATPLAIEPVIDSILNSSASELSLPLALERLTDDETSAVFICVSSFAPACTDDTPQNPPALEQIQAQAISDGTTSRPARVRKSRQKRSASSKRSRSKAR